MALSLAGLLALGSLARAAEPPPPLEMVRRGAPIEIDGDLSDAGWQGAAVIDAFWETQPGDNAPPKVRTVAYLTYDARYLYIGVRCEDEEPLKIRAPYVDRDDIIGTDDNVAIFLDTRGDRRTALELRVSPRGIQGDALFNDATLNEDFAPDFFYDTAARISDFGWSAEYRIPFSSLRYPKKDVQDWGILVWRNYPREYRYALHSSPVPRGSDCFICHCRTLAGLRDLPAAGGLVVAPYASAASSASAEQAGAPLGDSTTTGDVGLDVKWSPAAGTTLDATINPDFSQVEADVAQIGVNNRFALFYPEKRPFFLEGVDLFDTPINAVYTRTITEPRWGARATGKLGSSAYTVLVAQDQGGGSVVLPGPSFSDFAAQDFRSLVGIARWRRELGASFVGLVLTGREIDGGGHNRVVGPDFQWRASPADRITGQLLWSDSETPDRPDLATEWDGRKLSGHGLNVSWNHTTRRLDSFAQYADFGDEFRADEGFVPQVGQREGLANAGWNFYPEGLLRRVRPFVRGSYSEDRGGRLLEREYALGVFYMGRRNLIGNAQLERETGRVGDEPLSATALSAFAQVDPSRVLTRLALEAQLGEFPDLENVRVGTGADLTALATLRPAPRLTLDLLAALRWLDVDAGAAGKGRLFTAEVYRVKAQLHFSARAFLRVIGQYVITERDPALYGFPVDRRSGSFLGSVLFSYKLNWQTALYAGYGDDRALDARDDLARTGRELFVKLSYAWQR